MTIYGKGLGTVKIGKFVVVDETILKNSMEYVYE